MRRRAPSSPVIAAFGNWAIFTEMRCDWPLSQRLRLRALRTLSRLSARRCDRILFVSEDCAQFIGEAMESPGAPGDRPSRNRSRNLGAERPAGGAKQAVHPLGAFDLPLQELRSPDRGLCGARSPPSRLPDLVIVADDQDPDYAQRMEAAREATGALASRIHILGEVPYAEVRRYYAGRRSS